eukprot:g2835.t1
MDFGAVADNTTINTAAIQKAIDTCHTRYPSGSTVLVPAGAYRTASIRLRSNLRLHLAAGAGLYGSADPRDYTASLQWFGGTHRFDFDSLIFGHNLTNVQVTGSNPRPPLVGLTLPSPTTRSATPASHDDASQASIIDGVGWTWWCQARCMPILQPWCAAFNPDNASLPRDLLPHPQGSGRPRLINIFNSTNVVLAGFTAQNSPQWTVHVQNSRNVLMQNLTVLSPRAVGNTDGIDPESSTDVLITDSFISVGDDGVSIKSYNITVDDDSGRAASVMVPCRNITMRRLHIRHRNWCIGSGTFGGIYDILFEDSIIGGVPEDDDNDEDDDDDETDDHDDDADDNVLLKRRRSASGGIDDSVPWAFKFKSHQYFPGPIENVTVRRIRVGHVGPTPWMYPDPSKAYSAWQLALSYGGKPPAHRSGVPRVRNVTFEDIHVSSSGGPGAINGLPGAGCMEGLTFRNVSFGALTQAKHWSCENVQASTFRQQGVVPAISCAKASC